MLEHFQNAYKSDQICCVEEINMTNIAINKISIMEIKLLMQIIINRVYIKKYKNSMFLRGLPTRTMLKL